MAIDLEWIRTKWFVPTDGVCVVNDWDTVDDLIDLRVTLQAEITNAQPLYILDDRDQAEYTSSHRASDIWPIGEENRAEYSAIMIRWLRAQLASAPEDPAEGSLIPIDEPGIDLLDRLEDPDRVFVRPMHCWIVESPDPSMAIAAKPNGYFYGDLSPVQNYRLAERLRESFGLEIFGLGSCSAAYCRAETISEHDARLMVDAVAPMYAEMTPELLEGWVERTTGRRWFLVSYRGA